MIDDVGDITSYYDEDPQREDLRLEHHQLEYELTWRYLNQYLPPQGSILEVGAATGKYTVQLARRGLAVTAVDLSPALIERCKKVISDEGLHSHVQVIVADARDLRDVAETGFDAVLMMGPLYHLIQPADREAALKEVHAHLRRGGLIFSTFLSRHGIMGDMIKNVPDWIEDQEHVRSLLAKGTRPGHYPRGGFRGYFAQVSEIAPLHEKVGFQTLALAGVEPAISADDDSYNRLHGKQRELWLDLLYGISADESIVGASRHLLYIGKKAP